LREKAQVVLFGSTLVGDSTSVEVLVVVLVVLITSCSISWGQTGSASGPVRSTVHVMLLSVFAGVVLLMPVIAVNVLVVFVVSDVVIP